MFRDAAMHRPWMTSRWRPWQDTQERCHGSMGSHATEGRMGTAASRPQLQRQLPLPVKSEKYPNPILLVDRYPIVGWFIIPINQPNQSTKLPVAEPRSHCCLLPPGMLRHRTSSKRHPSHLLEEGPRRCHLRIPSGYLTVCHGKYDRFYTVNHLSPINERCSSNVKLSEGAMNE